MTDELRPEPPVTAESPPRWAVWLAGMTFGNVASAILFWLATQLFQALKDPNLKEAVILPGIFIVPFFGGLAAAYFWRSLEPRIGAVALSSLWMTLMGIGGAAVFLKEGAICLLIVSPLYYALIVGGAQLGRIHFQRDRSRLNLMIFPLLAVFAFVEMATREEQIGVVTDELLINAPPEKVWAQVTAFPEIPTPPDFWLFRLGLPYPQSTTSAGDYVGAARRCIFSRNAVFEEVVVAIEPAKKLTFDIVEIPPDPELIGHLTPRRGELLLKDNGDGTTTLIGSTWYTLHVTPHFYFDWWTHHIFRAVHRRVMEDVRRRAEEGA